MTRSSHTLIQSRDNPFFKELKRLAQDSTAYRKQARVWLEGDHLCRAYLARGGVPDVAIFAESFWPQAPQAWWKDAGRVMVLADALLHEISALESPAPMGFVVPLARPQTLDGGLPTIVLDRLQDAGNVGAILRSASAFGFRQVLAMKGTAALWSPKVLRAGMGAHFALQLHEGLLPGVLETLQVPVLTTSSHQGQWLHAMDIPWPCAWIMGHEGQGVGEEAARYATDSVRIAQPGGEESLNVAVAAAICLHASAASMLNRTKAVQ